MSGILVSVGKESSVEIIKILNSYGTVGMVTPELFTVKTEESIDLIRGKIAEAFPAVSHVLIAEVRDTSFQGGGQIAFAASLLRS